MTSRALLRLLLASLLLGGALAGCASADEAKKDEASDAPAQWGAQASPDDEAADEGAESPAAEGEAAAEGGALEGGEEAGEAPAGPATPEPVTTDDEDASPRLERRRASPQQEAEEEGGGLFSGLAVLWPKSDEPARPPAAAAGPQDNPTVDVAAVDEVAVRAFLDTASVGWLRAQLRHVGMVKPTSVRVQDLVGALRYGYPAPAEAELVSLTVDAAPAPGRPGFDLVRVGFRTAAARGRAPVHVLLVVDATARTSPEALAGFRRTVAALAQELSPGRDRLSVVSVTDAVRVDLDVDPGQIEAALPRSPAGHGDLAAALRAALDLGRQEHAQRGRPVALALLTASLDLRTARTLEVQLPMARDLGRPPVLLAGEQWPSDDERLVELARHTGCRYLFAGDATDAALATARWRSLLVPGLDDVDVALRFDPRTVRRYRLLGYEHRRPGLARRAPRPSWGADEEVTLLFEVERMGPRVGGDEVDLGEVHLSFASGLGGARSSWRRTLVARLHPDLASAPASYRRALGALLLARGLRGQPLPRPLDELWGLDGAGPLDDLARFVAAQGSG